MYCVSQKGGRRIEGGGTKGHGEVNGGVRRKLKSIEGVVQREAPLEAIGRFLTQPVPQARPSESSRGKCHVIK